MKSKKFILSLIAFLSVYLLLGAYFSITKPKNVKITENTEPTISVDKNSEIPALADEKENQEIPVQLGVKESVNLINITLKVSDKVYTGSIKEGSSVYEAMQILSEKNNFTFKVKEYFSMGFFVEEINGEKGDTGKFWIYYVNNKKASIGVSKYILKSGDIVEWKQEANF